MGLHTIILDAGPLLSNDPSISSLVAKSEKIFTVPAVLSELKDQDARARVQTTVLPFLILRNPTPASLKVATDFARRTGDLAVLSKTDIAVIALAYELECERNQGDWRLRRVPGQKGLNGKPPPNLNSEKEPDASSEVSPAVAREEVSKSEGGLLLVNDLEVSPHETTNDNSLAISTNVDEGDISFSLEKSISDLEGSRIEDGHKSVARPLENLCDDDHDPNIGIELLQRSSLTINENGLEGPSIHNSIDSPIGSPTQLPFSDAVKQEDKSSPPQALGVPEDSESIQALDQETSDSEGWITPSNLKKHQAKDQNTSTIPVAEEKVMQVSTITSDFAMQNVLLQMNLNLLAPSLLRIKHLKTYILRCHACFQTIKQMDKQFCPRCGKPSLTRVSCSTNAKGEFQIHLKKNMQWNTRGDRYSIPKPISGTSNGRSGTGKGGGKGGWGQELILAEDQKEYVRAMQVEGRKKERNLMDEDYLPGILTGDRGKTGGRPRVGAGRNINSRKRT